MRLLDVLGNIESLDEDSDAERFSRCATTIDSSTDTTNPDVEFLNNASTDSIVCVAFGSSVDGRGFSWPQLLRTRFRFQGRVYASGNINPQQVTQALQVGFDGIVISDSAWATFGEDQWRSAGVGVVTLSYVSYARPGIRSIWDLRREQANPWRC